MDVNNPGLVDVASQVPGNPSTKVDATSVPENNNVLTDVADSAQTRPTNDVGSTTFPIPSEVVVGEQVHVLPSLALGQQTSEVPNVVVADAVLGQGSWQLIDPADPNSGRKWVPVSEFVVAGPGASLQTNTTDATEVTETITAVRDADTEQPLPPLGIALNGYFASVVTLGGTQITLCSPTSLPAGFVDGLSVQITNSTVPAYNGTYIISGVAAPTGTFTSAVNKGGGLVTFCSPIALPAAFADGYTVVISGSSVAAYDGARTISNVASISGSVASIVDPGIANTIRCNSPVALPATLVAGYTVLLSGSSVPAYDGTRLVSAVSHLTGTFTSLADLGGMKIRFTSPIPLPATLVNGCTVVISGSTAPGIDGTHVISGVTANTFDIDGFWTATGTGNFDVYMFDLNVAYAGTATSNFSAFTFDMTVAFSATATGAFAAHTFDVTVPFSASATGNWATLAVATRFRIYVNPATLTSYPISLLGREILFDGNITPANEGASRLITGYGANFVVVDRNDPSDTSVPILSNPQIGDTFTIDTEREGSEEFSRVFEAPAEVTIFPDPPAFVPNVVPNFMLTDSFVSTGVQPNDPNDVLTSGTRVPAAIDVKVSDQATTVGLPKDVFV
jgi:hypothetical protein